MSTPTQTEPFSAPDITLDGGQKLLSHQYTRQRGDGLSLAENTQKAVNGTLTMSTAPTAPQITQSIIDQLDQFLALYPTKGLEGNIGISDQDVPFGLDPLVFTQLQENNTQAIRLAEKREELHTTLKPALREYIEGEFTQRWEQLMTFLPGGGKREMKFGKSIILIDEMKNEVIDDRTIYLILDNTDITNRGRLRINMQSEAVVIASESMSEITLNTAPDNNKPLIVDCHNHVLSPDFTLNDVLIGLEEVLSKIDWAIDRIEEECEARAL